jgi:epoxyqueuosine reductase
MTADAAVALEQRIKQRATELGFDLAGVTRLGPANTYEAFARWLERGYAGEMTYLPRGAEKRRDTTLPFAGARSAIVVALDYGGKQPAGPIARYARGDDYHDVMIERLEELHHWLAGECGQPVAGKAYVDTGPILERDLAQKAGLGWFGKNTMLINPTRGSFFFLGALLVDLELEPDPPFETDRCGTCRRCLDACPTGALVEPRVMDATRCISYLTIEHRSEIEPTLRRMIGDLLYGCDICQDVCPYNVKFAEELKVPEFAPRPSLASNDGPTIARKILAMDDEAYRLAFQGSPMKRAKRTGLARNAAVVLANRDDRPG